MKFNVSKKALEDIENIWLYSVENWSVEQVERYYNLIFDEINFICKNFNSGKDYNHIRKGYRCAKIKSHLIFYRKSKNNVLEIIRVLYERMDIENKLTE